MWNGIAQHIVFGHVSRKPQGIARDETTPSRGPSAMSSDHSTDASAASGFARGVVDLLPRLRRLARGLTGSADAADDLVQATCERAFAARDQYIAGTRLDAWLFRIMRNQWIDGHRRSTARGGIHEDVDEVHDLAGSDGRAVAEQRLMLEEVGAALARLPAEQREVLVLVCVEDMAYREAAEVLGIPLGTVMSRLARGRKALARALGLEQTESEPR